MPSTPAPGYDPKPEATAPVRRPVVITLMCVGLAALSCQHGTGAALIERSGLAALDDATQLRPQDLQGASADAAPDPTSSGPEARIVAELRSRHTALSDAERIELARVIVEEADRHGLDPDLVMAVIQVESAGYHLAVSTVGALGLMQLLPATGEELAGKLGLAWYGPDSLFDPVMNVKLGTAYLRELSDRFESMPIALAAYNWGPGRIHRRLSSGASVPSRYIEQVMKVYDARDAPDAERS